MPAAPPLPSHSARSGSAWRLALAIGLGLAGILGAVALPLAAGRRQEQRQDARERRLVAEAAELARAAAAELGRLAEDQQRQSAAADDQARRAANAAANLLHRRVTELFAAPPPPPPRKPGMKLPAPLAFLQPLADSLAAAPEDDAKPPPDWTAERLREGLKETEWPDGCVVMVFEDFARRLARVGAADENTDENTDEDADEAAAAARLRVTASRDFAFFDGARQRFWQLQASVPAPAAGPPPPPAAAAAALDRAYPASSTLREAKRWRGLVCAAAGRPLAEFPPARRAGAALASAPSAFAAYPASGIDDSAPPGGDLPPEDGQEGWRILDESEGEIEKARLLRAPPVPPATWSVAVELVAARRAAIPATLEFIAGNPRWWGSWLGAAGLAIIGGGWTALSLAARRRGAGTGAPAGGVDLAALAEILTRAAAGSASPGTFADNGEWLRQFPPPGTSLRRLQALHRGAEALDGCKVLEYAASPLLRDLARRLRPGGEAPRSAHPLRSKEAGPSAPSPGNGRGLG